MASGPTLAVLPRPRRRHREEHSPDNSSLAFARSSPTTAGLPRYLRGPPAAEMMTEPETEEEIALNNDLAESDAQTAEGTEQSNAPTGTPESETSTDSGAGGAGSGEEPAENRNSSVNQHTNETVAAAGQAAGGGSNPTQLPAPATAPSAAETQAEAASSPEQTAAVAPVEEEQRPETTPTPPVPGMPAADAELDRGTADLNRTAEEPEIPTGAAPEPAVAATPESASPESASPSPPAAEGLPRGEATAAAPEEAAGAESTEAASAQAGSESAEAAEASDASATPEASTAATPEGAGARGGNPADTEAEAEPDAEADAAAATESDLLTAPDIPIAGDAGARLAQIDASCEQSAETVRADAAAKRQGIQDFFAEKRALASTFITGSALSVVGYFDLKRAHIAASLMAGAGRVQAFAVSLVTHALAMGVSFTSAIQAGVSAFASLVNNGIGAVITGALEIAESIPIPDLPGLGRIRNAVLRLARQATDGLRNALNNVQSFIEAAVASVIGAVQTLMASLAATVLNIVATLTAMVIRAITGASAQLSAIAQHVRALIHGIGRSVNRVLSTMERSAVRQINQGEAEALQEIERNRVAGQKSIHQMLEFCYASGDFPPDVGAHSHLDVVDNSGEKTEFESAALAAMDAVANGVQQRNNEIVRGFSAATVNITLMIVATVAIYIGELFMRLMQAFQEVVARVTQAVGQLVQRVAGIVTEIMTALGRMIANVISALASVVRTIVEVVRGPVEALANIGRTILTRVRHFLHGIISRLIRLFTFDSEASATGTEDASSLPGDLDQFEVSRLKSAARMTSPPALAAAALVLVAEAIAAAAAATAAALMTILFWVGVILLILLILYAIYRLIQPVMSKPRPVPRTRTRPKTKTKTRRRPRKPKKPLKWNPSLNMGVVTASGGMPGTLDTTAPLPRSAPLHGHHVWPKYVGGPVVQPLMSIRDTVHITIVHPGLHVVMKAAAIAMGQDITTNTGDPRNQAFIAHIRGNLGDRTAFAGVMTGFYAGLNVQTSPPIPAPAYGRGMAHSFPLI